MRSLQLIILNGTSSAGKTSIAEELQKRLDEVWLSFSIDAVLYALPADELRAMIEGRCIARAGYSYERLVAGYNAALVGLLSTGNRVIANNALVRSDWCAELDNAVAPYETIRIGVLCDLAVVNEREQARRDRAVGTAAAEYPDVHKWMKYDLTVDTTELSPDEAVAIILQHIGEDRKPRSE